MTLEALRQGHTVRGTLRSMKRADSVRKMLASHLGADSEEALKRLTFHEADLLSPEGWRDAAAGCDAALHVASPFPLDCAQGRTRGRRARPEWDSNTYSTRCAAEA